MAFIVTESMRPSDTVAPWLAYAYGVQKGIPNALTEPELRSLQLERLNATLEMARRSNRFYRSHLPVAKLSSLTELGRLPLMDAHAFDNGMERLLCVSQSEISRIVTLPTSGTVSTPKRIAFAPDDHEATVDFFAAGMRMLAEPKEAIAVLYPCNSRGGLGQLICEAVTRAGARPVVVGIPSSFTTLVTRFLDERVKGAVGFPQHLFAFARWCEYQSVNLPIRKALLSADNVSAPLKMAIERIWKARVYEHFGMTEMGYGGAVECDYHQGCHIRETDLICEIIDPNTGKTLPEGAWGELVFTTINRRAMPLVRYRTGDFTRMLPGECPCGSILKRFDTVKGRANEDIRLGNDGQPGKNPNLDGQSFGMSELEECLFAIPEVVDFKATWNARNFCLRLQVQTFSASALEAASVDSAVKKAPSLGPLLEKGSLKTEITVERVSDFSPYYVAKRRILLENAAEPALSPP
jgi:phenylacetate-coenzyme A ligase PaaK-like adenylate-forming protein